MVQIEKFKKKLIDICLFCHMENPTRPIFQKIKIILCEQRNYLNLLFVQEKKFDRRLHTCTCWKIPSLDILLNEKKKFFIENIWRFKE